MLKPIEPIEGIKEHEGDSSSLLHHIKEDICELVGTLTHEEAEAMQKLITEEFGEVEGG